MLRVVLGHGRPETEWSDKISGLHFASNHGGGMGAQASADKLRSHGSIGSSGTNTILTVLQSHLEHEVDIEARVGASNEDSSLHE
jgi:hypothetical protein